MTWVFWFLLILGAWLLFLGFYLYGLLKVKELKTIVDNFHFPINQAVVVSDHHTRPIMNQDWYGYLYETDTDLWYFWTGSNWTLIPRIFMQRNNS